MSDQTATIERIVPDRVAPSDATGRSTLELHLERYEFAAAQSRPGRLLDIACGVGYGTRLMAETAPGIVEAVGVDLAEEAIGYAAERYAGHRVRFLRHDAMSFADEAGFDTIVSLETFEHLPDPAGLLDRLVGLLRPGGVIVASVPTTPSVDVNPFHLSDFTERSFRAMFLARGLRERACRRQVQPYPFLRTLRRQEDRMKDMRPNLPAYYLAHPTALGRRLLSTLYYGFTNRYLTVAFEKRP